MNRSLLSSGIAGLASGPKAARPCAARQRILSSLATPLKKMVLRKKRPDLERPYHTLGYPLVPVLFVVMACLLVASTLYDSPRESLLGLAFIFAGLPFYFHWKKLRRSR